MWNNPLNTDQIIKDDESNREKGKNQDQMKGEIDNGLDTNKTAWLLTRPKQKRVALL
jgi:hypothetical protein